jgi:hypothetical protein
MMKPKFDDVIEYVRAGKDDPELEKQLDMHPDGKEFLKLARFICRMLEREDQQRRGGGFAALEKTAGFEKPSEAVHSASFSVESPESARISEGDIAQFLGAGPDITELGTLEFAFEDERVVLSYEPAEQADEFISSFLVGSEPPKPTLAGIHIRGATITLSLPESVLAGEPLIVHLSHGARQMPARRQEAVFMPEIGPFLKLRADEAGRIDMPVPEQPGTLRIDTRITELLQIRLKK